MALRSNQPSTNGFSALHLREGRFEVLRVCLDAVRRAKGVGVTHADAVVEHARDCIVPNWCVPRSEGRVPGRDFCD
ncbi:hypothetical protein N9L76_00760 [bacterium]|nr:hypothetical protein [bacterium]